MNFVFLTICVVATFAVVYGEDRGPRTDVWKKYIDECKAIVGATDEDVRILNMRLRLTTRGSQCLMACTKKKLGAMMPDNKIDVEKVKETIASVKAADVEMYNKMMKIIEECKKMEKPEADECNAAKNFSDCVMDKREAAGFKA